ncbi:SDR family NAD(P)-dependent oxidoreductase [Patulibacter defluvii]|uniref:SDR family NAD(P)-dependent oxidoreductase n=1 Tax=Patulibacter defluvii TaxID=3095358 RepID=UPI002A75C225|nr:SDR family oxidoreductase [Patulibacter sp. DM4]
MSASPSDRFAGKVVMIVGAARGVGLATAQAFAREGATLALADIDPAIESVATALDGVGDDRVLARRVDVTDGEQCRGLAAATVERFGRIDVLAVVSGVLQKTARISDLPIEEFDRVLAVNTKGPLLMAQAVLPQMREQGGGRIVNVASWFAYNGHAYFGGYCASKFALRAITQAIAEEEAEHGITANCVSPGNVDTEMHRRALREEAESRGITAEEMKAIEWAKIPLGHACPPEDIADAIVFLGSDQSRYMTGASLDVNGGVLLR